jgi:predicted phosphoribosyltransferase
MYQVILQDRKEAGILLSQKLEKYQNSDAIILAVPRGGVPIGYEISKNLHLPLDIILSKKIGHPLNKEYAIGAVSLDSTIINQHPDIPKEYIEREIKQLRESMKDKYNLYMGYRKPANIKGKTVIVVDDGIATGNTLLVSIEMLKKRQPKKIIVAVPVVPFDTVKVFEQNTDEFVYLMAPKDFRGVGRFYESFEQVADDEVIRMLGVANLTE